jgi:integrase
MSAKRTHGTGSLVERPKGSGKWHLRYLAGKDPVSGEWIRKSVTFNATSRRAAEKIAHEYTSKVEQQQVVSSVSTVDVMFNRWFQFLEDRGRAVTTLTGYRKNYRLYIQPALGEVPMDQVGPHHLDSLYSGMLKQGLSPASIRGVHRNISTAYNQAVKWGWVDRNPAERATPPQMMQPKMEVPTPAEARAFLAAAIEESPNVGAFVYLAAVTGCRRGEIAALKWTDVQDSTLAVTKSIYDVAGAIGVKSTKSGRERYLALDQRALAWLDGWKGTCEAAAEALGVALLNDGYIIPGWPDGSRPIRLDSISSAVRRVAKRTGLEHIHLHSLRHFVATEMIDRGFSAVDTAEQLGHADPSVTLRVYASARLGRKQEAASLIASLIDGADAPKPLKP